MVLATLTQAKVRPPTFSTRSYALDVVFKTPGKEIATIWIFSQAEAWPIKSFGKATGVSLPAIITLPLLEDFARKIVGQRVGIVLDEEAKIRRFVPAFDN